MNYRNEISILGFGCMRFPRSFEKAEKLVLESIEAGINYFDTAYIYVGNEKVLGQIVSKNNLRDKINIATKLPVVLCKKYEDFDKFFSAQLSSLKTDYIDYYLMHMLTDLTSWEILVELGIIQWIEKKKAEGKIKRIGFSFHGTGEEFLKILDAYPWEFCQIQYNYSDINFQAGVTGLKAAYEKNIPVIIMEPLLGGKLATGLPEQAVEAFEKLDKTLSPAAHALRWLWNQPEVTSILSGMNEIYQLEDNIQTANTSEIGMLGDKNLAVYDEVVEIFKKNNKIPCTGCGYCLPCPVNVNIPGCFSAYNAFYNIDEKTGRQQYLLGTGTTSTNPSRSSQCIQCGKCEKVCPQNIEIISGLKDVTSLMETFSFRIKAKATGIVAKRKVRNKA